MLRNYNLKIYRNKKCYVIIIWKIKRYEKFYVIVISKYNMSKWYRKMKIWHIEICYVIGIKEYNVIEVEKLTLNGSGSRISIIACFHSSPWCPIISKIWTWPWELTFSTFRLPIPFPLMWYQKVKHSGVLVILKRWVINYDVI